MTTPGPDPTTPQGNPGPNQDAQAAASAAAQQHQQARDLATAIQQVNKNDPGMLEKGVVTAVVNPGTPPTISVQLGGDTSTTIGNVRFMDSYSPVVGDTVVLAKQDGGLLALGQVADASTVTENGWTAPTLGGGFTTFSFDPVLYRMIVDNGSNKIQMRGRVDITGTPSALWTMPAGMRPLFDMAPILIAREFGGGSHVAIIDVKATGAIVLSGGTVGVKDVDVDSGGSGTSGGTAMGTLDANIQHTHFSSDGPNPATPSSWTTGLNTGSQVHFHNANSHSHSTPSHSHTNTLTPVTFPTFISFNGVEYFL